MRAGCSRTADRMSALLKFSELCTVLKMVNALHHVNVTVPTELEAAAKEFYGSVVGLKQVPKPAAARQLGAWEQIGVYALEVSVGAVDERGSILPPGLLVREGV